MNDLDDYDPTFSQRPLSKPEEAGLFLMYGVPVMLALIMWLLILAGGVGLPTPHLVDILWVRIGAHVVLLCMLFLWSKSQRIRCRAAAWHSEYLQLGRVYLVDPYYLRFCGVPSCSRPASFPISPPISQAVSEEPPVSG